MVSSFLFPLDSFFGDFFVKLKAMAMQVNGLGAFLCHLVIWFISFSEPKFCLHYFKNCTYSFISHSIICRIKNASTFLSYLNPSLFEFHDITLLFSSDHFNNSFTVSFSSSHSCFLQGFVVMFFFFTIHFF